MKTYSPKMFDIKNDWFVIDAENIVLGRLASYVACMLRGKHKPYFASHADCGDNIIIINAEKIYLSGNKLDIRSGKKYYRHTGFPGGIKEITAGAMLDGKYPNRVIYLAVKRMLPKNVLANKQIKRLFVYSGTYHPHQSQKPVLLDFASFNIKNKKSN